MRDLVIRQILEKKIVAIVRGLPEPQAVPLAGALLAGGIGLIEVTFDQAAPESFPRTASAIAAIRGAYGGKMHVGAGTVMTPGQLRLAYDAGAQFIISPNVDAAVIHQTRENGLVSLPGCMTPTECAAAHGYGADFIKIFPAGVLGPGYFKALLAPLSHLKFLAVGGVDCANIPDFLRAGALGFGVGGNLVNREWIAAGEFDRITAAAREYASAAAAEIKR
ncbi:MAG: bifunctional 4-hydroxy-2-oxoglutarate aldolase/2-dehydro-3-deoxy-phosphogluconate aldolase [Oscillospiraceae bacterium]|jgi:2-dehydro-3-deoxyphosphogluconate aldolase/(4S)-4-hydroxy-2-oxoglutarate aldolase|nr:bifunctional 4-hydroxy-2-oxoglutarate aldolase/2-dehydro-3-deoxy-phosphogluconate aldolase [Oscillospiraceae bacterium]